VTDLRCIWCLGHAEGTHEEHIFPEAIGCPVGFVLPGTVVCRKCNNGLAHLDKAVADEFDFLAFMACVPRKKGKPPLIKSRGNVLASIQSTGPTYTFNMENYPVRAHDGSSLAPFRGSQRNIRAQFSNEGSIATVAFDVPFGANPKFVRGLTKIAFSSLAYFLGAPVARDSAFDAIRRFVLKGAGGRHVLLSESQDSEYRNSAWPPFVSKSGGYAVTFRIARIEFLVDLTENEADLPIFEAKAREQYGEAGWCTLPPGG
jgi:hypothetical protein